MHSVTTNRIDENVIEAMIELASVSSVLYSERYIMFREQYKQAKSVGRSPYLPVFSKAPLPENLYRRRHRSTVKAIPRPNRSELFELQMICVKVSQAMIEQRNLLVGVRGDRDVKR